MRSKRLLLLLVLAAGATFVGVEVAQHMRKQTSRDPRGLLQFTPGVPLQVRSFHRSMVRDGRKEWEIRGAEATYYKTEERIEIRRPRLVFHREDGRTLEARGREGNVFLPGGHLEQAVLNGAVDMAYPGARFRTDRLVYHHRDDRVDCPARVWAMVDGVEFEGESMTYSLSNETLEVLGKVRTTIHAGRRDAGLPVKRGAG